MSEASLATAVPDPMAIPISAFFRAGASLTPSPVWGRNRGKKKKKKRKEKKRKEKKRKEKKRKSQVPWRRLLLGSEGA